MELSKERPVRGGHSRRQVGSDGHQDEKKQRGATLVEYALVTALFLTASLGAFTYLTRESGEYLVDTGSQIGEPRDRISDIDHNLPAPPAWVP